MPTFPRLTRNTSYLTLSAASAFFLLASVSSPAETKVETKLETKVDTKPDAKDAKDADAKSEEPVLSVTAHTVVVNGKTIKYHATAGYMILKEEEGKPLVA